MEREICLPESKVKNLLNRFETFIDTTEREIKYLRKAYEEIKKELKR